jgi:nicotinamidase-related amidase
MYKPRWGAFYQTGLESFLRERGIDTIVFTGCNFPNCPRTSMYEASERDFRVVMVADSMSQVYDKGVSEMNWIGIHVCHSDDLLLHLG